MTILDILENADYNINHDGLTIGKEQLHNAILLINKGYNLFQDVSDLFTQFEDIDDVPDYLD